MSKTTAASQKSPLPTGRLDIASIIPVRLKPAPARKGATARTVTVNESITRSNRVDLKQTVVQSGEVVPTSPQWCTGPAPFIVERAVRDRSFRPFQDGAQQHERERLASPMVRRRLYGSDERWHRAPLKGDWLDPLQLEESGSALPGDLDVLVLELLRFEQPGDGPNGLLIVHASCTVRDVDDALAALRLLTLQTKASQPLIERFVRGVGKLAAEGARPYHLCMLRPYIDLPECAEPLKQKGWSPEEQWLWLLATLQHFDSYAVSERNREQLAEAVRPLSGDWSCAIMRGGLALLTRPLSDDWELQSDGKTFKLSFLAEMAPLLMRSLYTDAVALGVVKGICLDGFAHELARLDDPTEKPKELIALEARFTRFRNTLWWEDTGHSGHSTMLLRGYGAMTGQRALFDRLVADFSDYSQKVERSELQRANEISQGTTALIGLVTCFGIPLGVLQVFGTTTLAVWVAVAAYMIALGVLPAGDQILAYRPAKEKPRSGGVFLWVQ